MKNKEREVENLHITGYDALPSPAQIKQECKLEGNALETVKKGQQQVKDILERKDNRIIAIVGPCSIHSPIEAVEYAKLLKPLADELADKLLIVMRVYFEKPRTSIGWDGLIYDPHLDGSHRIDQGIRIGRKLMVDISEIGLPIEIGRASCRESV